MTPRRFFFATIGYPPFVGGAQSYVKQLAESLVADGHEVTVFTTDAAEVERIWDPRKGALLAGEKNKRGVQVKRLPLRHLPGAPYSHYALRRATVALAHAPGVPERALTSLARFTPWLPGLRAALAGSGPAPDLVHSFAIPFESIVHDAETYAATQGVLHLVTPFLHVGRRGYAMPHQLGLMRRAAAVVALTEIERDFLVNQGLGPSRVQVIPGGIPGDGARALPQVRTGKSACATSKEPNILFLGALTYEKGAVCLVEAAKALWREGLDIGLTLAGDATDQFLRYHRRLPEADRARVALPGVVSEERKQELLRGCTALALPSRVDSFGLVLLEAWAHARPVIGARAGGIPAVVDHGENGLLAPFGDVPGLAAAILRLVTEPGLAARLGANGHRKLLERYTWEVVYPQLLELYQQVLAA